ncbi:MAG: prepilin-type N-terminal cleavage/methylation domain-containing protein [Candidatus Omnitrophica bacterium]|nr:prepilin-type N-terminal cleavage/methylation domain-containing protein [Candidatus Omnitrophota bacterium]
MTGRRPFSKSGLTLVELAVAAAIAGLMMAAVYVSVSAAFSAWRRFQKGTAIDAAIALDRLSTQFANAPTVGLIPFEAGAGRVAFAGLVNNAPAGQTAQWTLGKIIYEYDAAQKALCVTEQPYTGTAVSGSRCLVFDVDQIQLEYGRLDPDQGALVWSSEWNPPSEDPRQYPWALRIRLTRKAPPGSEGTVLTKIAAHPAS